VGEGSVHSEGRRDLFEAAGEREGGVREERAGELEAEARRLAGAGGEEREGRMGGDPFERAAAEAGGLLEQGKEEEAEEVMAGYVRARRRERVSQALGFARAHSLNDPQLTASFALASLARALAGTSRSSLRRARSTGPGGRRSSPATSPPSAPS
jgi:hypothetical protein